MVLCKIFLFFWLPLAIAWSYVKFFFFWVAVGYSVVLCNFFCCQGDSAGVQTLKEFLCVLFMPPKRVAVVPPVDYHVRTRSASRNLALAVDTPRVVTLIPDSDSEGEERPSRRLSFDISPDREEPEQVNVALNMDPDLVQALTNFANGAAQDRAQYQGRHDALMNILGAQKLILLSVYLHRIGIKWLRKGSRKQESKGLRMQ